MKISPRILLELRRERGWSQEKLSAICGISERTIQRAEKDGSCSLDTKMALATAFDISPSDLAENRKTEQEQANITYTIDPSGIIGLFVLGLATILVALITKTNGTWDLISFGVTWGLTIIICVTSFGARETYSLFDNASWIVKYPSYVPNLNKYICQSKAVISNSYIVGVSSALVAGVTMCLHTTLPIDNFVLFSVYAIKPLVYSVLFSELWFRPYKRKMERMLQSQVSET